MLADVNDVAKRAGALLDDPSNSIFTLAYLMPFIDQCYDILDVELERCGMQYIESIAVFNVTAGTTDLSSLLQDGQPLATMKLPKQVKWKLVGEPDYLYRPSTGPVVELDEVDTSQSIGALQWRFGDGALQITPSVVDITLKVYFDQMSTNIYDPSQNVIRGTAHILAAAVAWKADARRKGMENRAKENKAEYVSSLNAFKSVVVQNQQSNPLNAKPMHPRRNVPTPYVPAPSS